jgi:very-short-patch-repair endonuclease
LKYPKRKKIITNSSPLEDKFYKTATENYNLQLIRQYGVGKYKLDFAYLQDDLKIAIEIDGSKFHRTTEQLNSDYKRERFLLLQGYTVIRFTGSEVFNHCNNCITQLITILNYLKEKNKTNTNLI